MGSLLFLGTGASSGCPVIGCICPTCRSKDVKNRRLRSSALVKLGGKTLLIDSGPDIRQQALQYGISAIDGVILTHTHFDHIGGLEELRIYNFMQKQPLPCLLSAESYRSIQKLFYYLFCPKSEHGHGRVSYTSQFDFQVLHSGRGVTEFCGQKIGYFSYKHGGMSVLGVRLGDIAYVTDIKEYPETIFEDLAGVSTLIVSALRFGRSDLQFALDDACDFAEKTGAKMTYLMHMSHELEYTHIQTLLPDTIRPAYDGLELIF